MSHLPGVREQAVGDDFGGGVPAEGDLHRNFLDPLLVPDPEAEVDGVREHRRLPAERPYDTLDVP
jgi:hypothetical protein